jgi:hypothetical protein
LCHNEKTTSPSLPSLKFFLVKDNCINSLFQWIVKCLLGYSSFFLSFSFFLISFASMNSFEKLKTHIWFQWDTDMIKLNWFNWIIRNSFSTTKLYPNLTKSIRKQNDIVLIKKLSQLNDSLIHIIFWINLYIESNNYNSFNSDLFIFFFITF